MGRALFSKTHRAPAVAVRTEPDLLGPPCEKWSVSNRFDPDSDEFFEHAQYEAFIDPETVRREQAEGIAERVRRATILDVSSDSSSDSGDGGSEVGSPMATGLDDPAVMLANTIAMAEDVRTARASRQFLAASASANLEQWRTALSALNANTAAAREQLERITADMAADNIAIANAANNLTTAPRSNRNRPRSASAVPAVLSASTVRSSIIAADVSMDQIPTPPRSPVLSRPVVVFPPSPRSRSRSPVRVPATPSTPHNPTEDHSLISPSPPGSVTPARPYSWRDPHWHPIPAIPNSPTRTRNTREGPLTNPRARMSYARLTTTPVLVRNAN
ncbi:hypothetical protein CC1G_00825 [Coprinopsis cinerea okayama7|uniref:Uncharacterized protein n=1 Tax=Coprinopsis cinerea (strain Okayama-7 / 130 / ATCC MYA-4618 / FGSC 9003) TaxID=240176 RepID=A8N8V0_COPC7|nr:hypothetical protein CC1G_00825 [Coprinopsis cinerea okayama7\|eukprot:XP_001831278.1 hypothetical protein CC1G_00825 [Coprinopsis cinerea okayama7\